MGPSLCERSSEKGQARPGIASGLCSGQENSRLRLSCCRPCSHSLPTGREEELPGGEGLREDRAERGALRAGMAQGSLWWENSAAAQRQQSWGPGGCPPCHIVEHLGGELGGFYELCLEAQGSGDRGRTGSSGVGLPLAWTIAACGIQKPIPWPGGLGSVSQSDAQRWLGRGTPLPPLYRT